MGGNGCRGAGAAQGRGVEGGLLMFLAVNFLCHPTIHLTPAADYPALRSTDRVFTALVCTHLVNLWHAAAVRHLERDRRGGAGNTGEVVISI